ncbi:uncharacterized protein [Solanum lycopersicum]|uniref:uncharacterized protein n=1 Tax=Solanum lycopersicum TaxID=4081 RepID=UPI003747F198
MEGEQVLLKVSPMKGVMWFGKRSKLNPRYICPFEVLKCIGEVAYELALPPGLSGVHPVFHVSMLKRYHGDGNYIIRWDSVFLNGNFSYEEEPVAILDREVRKLRSREIASIKVQWKNRPVEEATWEKEVDMPERYPHLFTDSAIKERQNKPRFFTIQENLPEEVESKYITSRDITKGALLGNKRYGRNMCKNIIVKTLI